ncbi:Acetyl esterase [Actinosynnema sp. ALI-1.44]
MSRPVLEPAARAFADATAHPPHLFDLGPEEGRKVVDGVQSPQVEVPGTTKQTFAAPALTVFRPDDTTASRPDDTAGPLPVVLYVHGAGWVFGNNHTHDRLAREIAAGTGAAVVFPDYSLSPEAKYPTALNEIQAAARWVVEHGHDHGLDPSRIAVAGDSVGGNMAAALTLSARDIPFAGQVLFYPVTDAAFDTPSYHEFAEGYFLRRDAMQWFWDQYTTSDAERAQITASPLRATTDELRGLPPALVITAEADVLRDEGEAYANNLRAAGVPVTAVRYQGVIHDFVMLNALRGTHAAEAAITQAVAFLRTVLRQGA